jgi:hypothetical protein
VIKVTAWKQCDGILRVHVRDCLYPILVCLELPLYETLNCTDDIGKRAIDICLSSHLYLRALRTTFRSSRYEAPKFPLNFTCVYYASAVIQVLSCLSSELSSGNWHGKSGRCFDDIRATYLHGKLKTAQLTTALV